MLSTSQFRIPPLIPALGLVAALLLPACEAFGDVSVAYRIVSTALFFVVTCLLGWFSTTVKPSRGEAFLSALLCALLFYPLASSNVVTYMDQRAPQPDEVVVEYRGVGVAARRDGGADYYVIASKPGARAPAASIPVTPEYYEELLAANLGTAAPLTLKLSRGLLGLHSAPKFKPDAKR